MLNQYEANKFLLKTLVGCATLCNIRRSFGNFKLNTWVLLISYFTGCMYSAGYFGGVGWGKRPHRGYAHEAQDYLTIETFWNTYPLFIAA